MKHFIFAGIKKKEILSPAHVVHPGGIRRKNANCFLIWVFYYTWVAFFTTWWSGSAVTEPVFDMRTRSALQIAMLLSAVFFVLLLRKGWYGKAARCGTFLLLASLLAFFTLPDLQMKMVAALSGSVAIGCINICILIPFVFTLNNTEKLYAVVSANFLIQVLQLMNGHSFFDFVKPGLSLVFLTLSLSALVVFGREAGPKQNKDGVAEKPAMSPRIYLSLLFNCAIAILCKGAGEGILLIAADGNGPGVLAGYYAGGISGCFLYLLVYAFTQKPYIWLGNITFSSVAIGLLCNAFIPQIPVLAVPFAVFLGIGTTIGMINMFYIISVIGKKYNNLFYIRLSVLCIGICGGVIGVVVRSLIAHVGTFELSVFTSILSAVVMLAFMFVSPVMERAEYVNDWGRDSAYTEVGGGRIALLQPYGLSKREAEVCDLLLQGYTLRQAAGLLSIAYSTVNTYCTSAYRKLEINSRTELILKFKDLITE